ncbi:unnamed protein product, partial [Laminaria digitata]
MPLQPWANQAAVMAPALNLLRDAGNGSRGELDEKREAEASNLYGQVLAWSEDGSVVAVSTPMGGVACLCNLPEARGVCLATVLPRGRGSKAWSGKAGSPGAGIAGVALR